ncbi:hypothetical protein [Litoribacillus peritrichatus]|uniref:Uncharacterized protein n=1 Tax=Litoribacillus peritrichatus TaxID=718191 RepID=A0ABP7MKN1_9GAMM
MTSINTTTTGINPIVQPLNVGEEERVSNTTRNPDQDNIATRAPEATDESAPRNASQSSTEPQDELNRRDDPLTDATEQNSNITVTPDEGNETTGDRSENSVTVTLSGPNDQEVSATLSREQLFNQVDQRQQQDQAEQFISATQRANGQEEDATTTVGNQGNTQNIATAVAQNSATQNSDTTEGARETAVSLVETRQNNEIADFAFEQFANASDEASDNTTVNTNFLETEEDATENQTRNTLVSSFVDQQNAEQRVGTNLDASA